MLELVIITGLVLFGVVAFIDTGAGKASAGRLGTRISTILTRISATVDEMNYATRRQAELRTTIDLTRETAGEK